MKSAMVRDDLLEVLLEISEKMNSTFDINELLPEIITLAREYLDVQRISVMLRDGENLHIAAHEGFSIEGDPVVRVGEGISGLVAATGAPFVVNQGEETREEMGYRADSFLSLPLKTAQSAQKVMGVLNLTDKKGDHFSEDDVKIATYIASQCALAVERSNLIAETTRNENLRTIGMLRSSVAHDIKNLINIVQAYLDLIDAEPNGNPEMKEYVDSIYAEVKRIQGLTVDMLEYSKQKIEVSRTGVNVWNLFGEIQRHLHVMLRGLDVQAVFDIDETLEIQADREKLFRVVFNLINNAVDAVGEKGVITVTAKPEGDEAVISVMDNGKGIDEESLPRVFEPFFSSGKLKGTGLGLAIVKEIVTAHGGTIDVDSKRDTYTKFTLRIPVSHG